MKLLAAALLRLVLPCAALLPAAGFAAAQQPTPAPTPPAPAPTPPAQDPAPTPPRPAAADPTGAPGEPGDAPAERGDRRAGRGRGRGGQGDGRQNQELPEFTPVAAPPLQGLDGKQYFWFTMYPDFVVQYDPATDAAVRKVKLQKGLFWSTTLTHDRKRLLVVTDQQQTIEVVDLAKGEVVATHGFAETGFAIRIRDVRELAGGQHWFVRTERVKKEVDRYSFEPAQWLLYDSQAQKVVRKQPRLPEALERSAQLSPDGAFWHTQDQDGNLLVLDGRKLTEVGKIDLKTPRHFGAGAIRLTGTDLLDRRDPNRALMLFTTTDPVEKGRTNWGVCELDLQQRRVAAVTEWGPQVSAWGLRVAPRKRMAAAMLGGFGGGFGGGGERDGRARLVMYDLTTGLKVAEALEEFRPRRSLVAIAPDADKIYIGTAGSDFEVFDAKLQRLKTVELEGEVVGRIFVVDG